MSWVYLGLLVLGSWFIESWAFAWGVLAGGIVSVISFWVSYRDVTAFIDALAEQSTVGKKKGGAPGKTKLLIKFWLRIAVIGVVLLLLIRFGDINVFGLILGLTTVVFTITMSGFGVIWRYYFSRR
ncbi:MAG: ATP synthase subunit I [Desulfofustis sp.]|nr:ATP synthase subunit I [Desulfofustis sp.]